MVRIIIIKVNIIMASNRSLQMQIFFTINCLLMHQPMTIKSHLERFYQLNKQAYSYNFSIEKNCFADLRMSDPSKNLLIIGDIYIPCCSTTMLLIILQKQLIMPIIFNLVLNVKHIVLSPNALNYLYNILVEFMREPIVFKFGIKPLLTSISQYPKRIIKFVGLNLNTNQQLNFDGSNKTSHLKSDYFASKIIILYYI